MEVCINLKRTTNKEDLEIIKDIKENYEFALFLLQSKLKLCNVYVMITNYDMRTNGSQIYRVEHRKRTMIKINFEEMREDYIYKLWKQRYSKEYLPKKLSILDHSLFILLHEIAHYIRKDHLRWSKDMCVIEQEHAEIDCDIKALKYLKLLRTLYK